MGYIRGKTTAEVFCIDKDSPKLPTDRFGETIHLGDYININGIDHAVEVDHLYYSYKDKNWIVGNYKENEIALLPDQQNMVTHCYPYLR